MLLVISSLGTGGAERSLVELLPNLRASGFRPVVVYFARGHKGLEQEVAAAGIELRFVTARFLIGRVLRLARLLRSEVPALVCTTLFDADVAGRLAAVGTGIPVMTTLVNTSYDSIRLSDPNVTRWRLAAVKRFDGFTARHLTSHFHAISRTVQDAAVEALGIDPTTVTVVHRGRDPDRLGTRTEERKKAARRALDLDDDRFVVVNVGRREYQKGQETLIEAVALIAHDHPDISVLIAGRHGRAAQRLDDLTSNLGIDQHVRFLGNVTDVPDLLCAADAFAFPSRYEGFGGALVEAMALGLPIVASDLPAIREVVDDGANALLVPPGDAGALARALIILKEDRTRAERFGLKSREIFEHRFTLDRIAPQMIDLYRKVAEAGRH